MKKIINQAPIVRYRASVSEIFFPDFWNRHFSAESIFRPDPGGHLAESGSTSISLRTDAAIFRHY